MILKTTKKNPHQINFAIFLVRVGGMLGLVCCGLQVQLRCTHMSPGGILSCVCTVGAGKNLVALPSLLGLVPMPWLAQQGSASFLPGCQPWTSLPIASTPRQPCPSCAQQGWSATAWHGHGPPELGPWWWRSCYHFPSLEPSWSNRNWGCFLLSRSTFSARSPASAPFIYAQSMSDFLLSNFCLILPLSLQEEVVFLLHYSPPPHSLNENSFTGFPPLAKQREV